MSTNITIHKITVLKNASGQDTILLHTSLPNGSYPFNGFATADIKVASLTGMDYVKRNFPDDMEVQQIIMS